MGNIDNTYLKQLKSQVAELERQFNLQGKLHATFHEMEEIINLLHEIKTEIRNIETSNN